MTESYAFFEQKPTVFGHGVIGLRSLTIREIIIPIYEWEEFKPFLKFHALDNLDFWNELSAAVRRFAPEGAFVLRAYGLPRIDDLLADELYDLEDDARRKLWVDTAARLESAAEKGQALAQKLLGDYYGSIREYGLGGDVEKALHWYEEAAKSGIIDLSGDYEIWDESDFDEEIEPFLFCGEYSLDEND